MPGFVAGVGKRRQAPSRCRFGCLGLGRKICTSCRTAATSTCFPASSTRHRSRRLMRIGRHREGSAVPAGRARQGDSRKIPINVMAVTSTSSTIRRHDKPYDPSSYISGTQGDNKTNGENNRTRGPHTIVGLTLSSSTKDSFSATLTQTRKNVLSCRLNPAFGVGGRQPMTQDESRAHLLSTVLGRHQTAWCHGFARFVDGGDTSPPRTKYIAYSCYSTIRDGGRGKQDGVLDE